MAIIEYDKLALDIAIFGNEGNIECDVAYCYYDAIPGNEIDPPEPEYVEISTIEYKGIDIGFIIDAIQKTLIAEWKEQIIYFPFAMDKPNMWRDIADKILVKKRGY